MVDEYIPFEKALEDLQMSREELRRLVSEDEIQALREEGGKIKIRKADVEALKAKVEEVAEDLEFVDEEEGGEDAGMVTAVLEDDSLLEEEETLDLSPEELEVEEEPEGGVPTRRARPTPVRSRGRAASIRTTAKPEGEEGTLERVLAVLTTVFLVYGLVFAYSIIQGANTGMTRWLADMFKDKA